MTLTHSTVVVVADDGTSPVGTNEWNADHVVGGTSLQVQYNNAGVLTGMGNSAWDSTSESLSFGRGAVAPLFNLSPVRLELVGDTNVYWHALYLAYGNNPYPATHIFAKTRNGSPAGHTVLQAADRIFSFSGFGNDGTNYFETVRIDATVDVAPTSGLVPGRLSFYTRGTDGNFIERLAVSNSQVEVNGRIIENQIILTDGATVALDALQGTYFKLTAAGNRTISVPTNKPAAGKTQRIVIAHEAAGADRTLALTTGSAGAFRFGTDITGLTATTNGLVDYIGCIYNASDDRWDVVSYSKGY
jgi:hypothetical protein